MARPCVMSQIQWNMSAPSRVGSRMRCAIVLIAACSSAHSDPTPAPSTKTVAANAVAAERRAPAAPTADYGDASSPGTLVTAHVVASVDGGVASERPAYARSDQRVTLFAVVEVAEGRTKKFFTDAPALELRGKKIATEPLAHAPRIALAWNRIEPAAASYSNGDGPTFHFETIEYRATPIEGAQNKPSIVADVRPTLIVDHGNGVGTMRYQVVATQGDRTIATPGIDAHRGKGSGGLTDAVLRVSIRTDDTYLGYLTEMYGQPYVWASAGLSDRSHQSERLEGSDCADFIVYGARRMGADIPYMWTGALPQVTRLLAPAGTRSEDGIYRDARGTPLPFTQAGDIVLFPRHVGVLTEDRGEPGVLDDQDLMMHTLFDTPKQQPIADSGYADRPVELRRFKQRLPQDRSRS
jgi:hypothetical protein